MITTKRIPKPRNTLLKMHSGDFGYGDLFSASLDKEDSTRRIYFKVYDEVVDVVAPLNTYSKRTLFYRVEMLDGELQVWPR